MAERLNHEKETYLAARSQINEEMELLRNELKLHDEESEKMSTQYIQRRDFEEGVIRQGRESHNKLCRFIKAMQLELAEGERHLQRLERARVYLDTHEVFSDDRVKRRVQLVEEAERQFVRTCNADLERLNAEKAELTSTDRPELMHNEERYQRVLFEIEKHILERDIRLQLLQRWRGWLLDTHSRVDGLIKSRRTEREHHVVDYQSMFEEETRNLGLICIQRQQEQRDTDQRETELKENTSAERQRLTMFAEYVSVVEDRLTKLIEEKKELEDTFNKHYKEEGEKLFASQQQLIKDAQQVQIRMESSQSALSPNRFESCLSAISASADPPEEPKDTPPKSTPLHSIDRIAFFGKLVTKLRNIETELALCDEKLQQPGSTANSLEKTRHQTQKRDELIEVKRNLVQAQLEIKVLKDTVASLNHDVEVARARLASLQSTLPNTQEQNRKQRRQKTFATERRGKQLPLLGTLEAKRQALLDEVQAIDNKLEAVIQEFDNSTRILVADISQRRATVEAIEADLERHRNGLSNTHSRMHEKEQEMTLKIRALRTQSQQLKQRRTLKQHLVESLLSNAAARM